jgi:hypothetical protein
MQGVDAMKCHAHVLVHSAYGRGGGGAVIANCVSTPHLIEGVGCVESDRVAPVFLPQLLKMFQQRACRCKEPVHPPNQPQLQDFQTLRNPLFPQGTGNRAPCTSKPPDLSCHQSHFFFFQSRRTL